MLSTYRKRLAREIEEIPQEIIPTIYRIVRVLRKDLRSERLPDERGSLRGIWEGSKIDEELFLQAKRSLFRYEYR